MIQPKVRKALILDDAPPFEKLFTLMMALLDWKCEVVTCREEAVRRLKASSFDVVIANYHLSQGNGFHFICCLRREGISVPAIVMSDDARVLRLASKELLNISAVLLQPFTVSELQSALAKIGAA